VLSRVPINFPEDFIAVGARMGIAPPCIYRNRLALHSGFDDGLAEREKGLGSMSPQFDKQRRSKCGNQVARERNVSRPVPDSMWFIAAWSEVQRRAVDGKRRLQFVVESNTRLLARPRHQRPRKAIRFAKSIGCTGRAYDGSEINAREP